MPSAAHNSMNASFANDTPPVATFTYATSDLTVSFDASTSYDPDGTVIYYEWDFGDGTGATGITTSHTYASAGTYVVALKVTDNEIAHSSVSHSVTVTSTIPSFTLGTTKPSATNTGYAANGYTLAQLGTNGTLSSAVAPGSGSPGANSSPQNVPGMQVVAGNSTLDGYVINGDVVLMVGATLRRCIVHGRVIDYGGGCLIENNEIDGYDTSATYTSASVGGVFLYQNLRPTGTTQSTLQFNRIHARTASTYANGPGYRNYHAYRNEVYDVIDGLDVAPAASGDDPNVRLEGNYVHNLMQLTPDSAHSDNMSHCDGTQMHGNVSALIITGNYYESTYSAMTNTGFSSYQNVSCLMLNDDLGTPYVSVTKNWFYGAQVMINGLGSSDAKGTFQDNHFDTSTTPGYAAAFLSASQPNITWSGNTDQNGAAVTPYYK